MSYGYSDEVVLPIPVTAPADLVAGRAGDLARPGELARLREGVHSRGGAGLAHAGRRRGRSRRRIRPGAPLIARARRAVPSPSPWPASFTATPETVTLHRGRARPRARAHRRGVVLSRALGRHRPRGAPAGRGVDAGGITLEVARGQLPEATAAPIDGVLVLTERLDGGTARQAFTLRATPGATATSAWRCSQAMALALAGGLVLNLMPCVLPVLSVKALGLVQHATASPAAMRRHGARLHRGRARCRSPSVAGALLALRAGGEQIGWGFQLQSPLVVTLLAYLLFAMALACPASFVIGGRLAGAGQALAARPGYRGLVLHGRARHRRGHAVHGAVHGRGGRLRGHPALADGAARLRGARPRARAAVSAADADPGLAPLPAAARARGWSGSSSSWRSRSTPRWRGSSGC